MEPMNWPELLSTRSQLKMVIFKAKRYDLEKNEKTNMQD